jgi:hypothetical protein
MRTMLIHRTSLVAAGLFLTIIPTVLSTATAAALPTCTNTTPTTTQCERPGNAQINTTPGVTANNYWGWPWWGWGGGVTIGIGRIGGR